ncbi:MAG: hypothetical protein ABR586_05660 [Thermoplasmatota archaeon]
MHRSTLCALSVATLLTLVLPSAFAVGPAPAPATLRQRIDWAPTHFVTPEELPALPAAEPTGPAVPELYYGIGPGSALLVGPVVGYIAYLCSAAFLFLDSTGNYYLGTAGHCLVRDETETSPHSGYVDPSRTNHEIDICVILCLNNALELGTYVRLYTGMPGAPSNYTPVLFGQSGGVGTDFGLIRIPPSLNSYLRPWMPQFGGPTGQATGTSSGSLIAHYGHGTYCCPAVGGVASRTPADQGRLSVSLGGSGASFSFAGWTTGGDSGSGMSGAVLDSSRVVKGTLAVGVLTHGLITGGVGYGTLLPRGLDMVHTYRASHSALPSSAAGPSLVLGSATI